jgi:hypothetical protein
VICRSCLAADTALTDANNVKTDDDTWQQRLLELPRNAKCIVVDLGESANLHWELQIKVATRRGLVRLD